MTFANRIHCSKICRPIIINIIYRLISATCEKKTITKNSSVGELSDLQKLAYTKKALYSITVVSQLSAHGVFNLLRLLLQGTGTSPGRWELNKVINKWAWLQSTQSIARVHTHVDTRTWNYPAFYWLWCTQEQEQEAYM